MVGPFARRAILIFPASAETAPSRDLILLRFHTFPNIPAWPLQGHGGECNTPVFVRLSWRDLVRLRASHENTRFRIRFIFEVQPTHIFRDACSHLRVKDIVRPSIKIRNRFWSEKTPGMRFPWHDHTSSINRRRLTTEALYARWSSHSIVYWDSLCSFSPLSNRVTLRRSIKTSQCHHIGTWHEPLRCSRENQDRDT